MEDPGNGARISRPRRPGGGRRTVCFQLRELHPAHGETRARAAAILCAGAWLAHPRLFAGAMGQPAPEPDAPAPRAECKATEEDHGAGNLLESDWRPRDLPRRPGKAGPHPGGI